MTRHAWREVTSLTSTVDWCSLCGAVRVVHLNRGRPSYLRPTQDGSMARGWLIDEPRCVPVAKEVLR